MIKEYGVICLKALDLLGQKSESQTYVEDKSVRVANGLKFAVYDDMDSGQDQDPEVMVLVFKDNQAINTMVELNFYALEGKTK